MRSRILSLMLVLVLVSAAVGVAASPANTYKPGTYTAEKPAHNGNLVVEVTFSETAMTDIKVVKSSETPGVAVKPLTELPAAIIAEQNLNVDAITGATLTSYAMKAAVEDCVKQAGGDPKALMLEKPAHTPTAQKLNADVVIVGAGGAGLAAAVAATDAGSSVIILEKVGYAGGNTMICGGIINLAFPDMQHKAAMTAGASSQIEAALAVEPKNDEHAALIAKVKEEYESYKASGETYLFDSDAWYALQTYAGGDYVGDLKLIEQMTSRIPADLKWLVGMGYEYTDQLTQGAGALYQRTLQSKERLGTGIINTYLNTLKDRNCQIIYNTPATELIIEDGRVKGAKGTSKNGDTYTVTANKGVILATGGFSRNKEMLKEYNTSGKWPDLSTVNCTNLPAMTGDGITMGLAAGAALRDMDQIQLLQVTHPKTGQIAKAYVRPLGVNGYIMLNKEGKRFVREDGRRDEICLAAMEQTDGMFYMLESADVITDPEKMTDQNGVPTNELVALGEITSGATLEELCQKLGMPYATVKAEVDEYNAAVDSGAAKDKLGRTLLTNKLENGPWYAIPRAPGIHHTMGGLVIDTECRVQNAQGQSIPGLYAAGEVTGGLHGGNRLGGNAVVDTIVFGRLAGESAAAGK